MYEVVVGVALSRGCGYMSYDIKKNEPTTIIDKLLNLNSDLGVELIILYIHASHFVENLILLGEN